MSLFVRMVPRNMLALEKGGDYFFLGTAEISALAHANDSLHTCVSLLMCTESDGYVWHLLPASLRARIRKIRNKLSLLSSSHSRFHNFHCFHSEAVLPYSVQPNGFVFLSKDS